MKISKIRYMQNYAYQNIFLTRLNARKMEQESLKAAQMAEATAALVSKESSSSLGSLAMTI